MARGLKFQIKEVEGFYYPCSENKGADLICAFVFAYANCWFSHDTAHLVFIELHIDVIDLYSLATNFIGLKILSFYCFIDFLQLSHRFCFNYLLLNTRYTELYLVI